MSRFLRVLAVGLLVWAWAAVQPAAAQYFGRNKVQYDNFDFRVFETEHFEFYYYPEERQAVEDAARMAERWYQRHSRTFSHQFREKKPVIFYANDADFQQTNVVSGQIGQGTGGVTESLKERVTMPLTGVYSETDHVLGHELVHSFQYDIALNSPDSLGYDLRLLPLWLIEGTAEYLSVGRQDPHTAMWMRDAVWRDDLPSMADLSTGEYFPYRYGQAYMAYLGGKYGDASLTDLYRVSALIGLDSALVAVYGIDADSLSNEWAEVMRTTYAPLIAGRAEPQEAGRRVLAEDIDAGEINVSPVLSPDGRYVAFLSERSLFQITLFVADAETGEVIAELDEIGSNAHFDAIRFIDSAGSWSPDGTRLAFISFAKGDNELSIWNVNDGGIERTIAVEGVSAMKNPAWSPDGTRIAFSGLDGGISDLYVLDLETNQVRQLTDDRYADLQPAWSPDGRILAFTTDRGPEGTDFERLAFAHTRIGLLNLEDGTTRIVRPFGDVTHHNPQFAPDGQSLYFIATRSGFKDIYRLDLTDGTAYQVTNLKTGVSGITSLSPAMTVAQQSGRLMFSVYSDNKYTVYAREASEAQGEPVDATPGPAIAGVLPPVRGSTLVENYLASPTLGLPEGLAVDARDYSPRLTLTAVAPPTLGASIGGPFGTGVSGGVGFLFSDMLGNQNLSIIAVAQGRIKDIGGQVSYVNRGNRFNWGGSVGHIPYLYGGAFVDVAEDPETGQPVQRLNQVFQRIYRDEAALYGAYPVSTTHRFEATTGFVRYGFDYEVERYYYTPVGIRRTTDDLNEAEPDPVYLFQSAAAFVGDYSNFGFTSPVQGARYRFQVSPLVGTANYVSVLGDARRYFFWNPVTFAVRGLHIGNYGASTDDLFAAQFLGYSYYPGFVRGYSFRSLESDECPRDGSTNGTCPIVDRLQGTRIALASAEIRVPVFGTDQFGLINFPYLPTELALFVDAGLAWTEDAAPVLKFARDTDERVPVFSTGLSARINVLGQFVFEIFYAYPFQRPDKGAHFGFQLAPGW